MKLRSFFIMPLPSIPLSAFGEGRLPVGIPYNPNKRKVLGQPVIYKRQKTLTSQPMSLTTARARGNYTSMPSKYTTSCKYSSRRRRSTGPYSLLSSQPSQRHYNPRYPPPEIKIDDFILAGFPITAAGVVSGPINAIAQGITGSTRIGTQVATRSCAYRLDFDVATTTPVPTSIRFMLIWDRQPN